VSLAATAADAPPADRAKLVADTNAGLKRLDKELQTSNSKVTAKLGVYKNATTELKNNVNLASGDAKSWTTAAESLAKTFDKTQNGNLLSGDERLADRKRLESEHLDPVHEADH
jgi:hypothetical protein